MTLPLLTHPIVREAAEGMAREAYDTTHHMDAPPFDVCDGKAACVSTFAQLLCDLSREPSRDWWVRWAANHECAIAADTCRRRLGPPRMGEPDDVTRIRHSNETSGHRDVRAKWSALRDNIPALSAAIMAALETT